jgi:phosphatidylserine synthase
MVSTIRYTSFKTVGKGKHSVYLLLIIAALGMLVWVYSQYMLFIIALAYVSHGIVWYLFSFLRPSKQIIEVGETTGDTETL